MVYNIKKEKRNVDDGLCCGAVLIELGVTFSVLQWGS